MNRRKRATSKWTMGCGVVWLVCFAWVGASQAKTPTALLKKLKRLERSKKTYDQHKRRHAGLRQKYERMVRMHRAESRRYEAMYRRAKADLKKTYFALAKHHKSLAIRYNRMARSELAKARRDKRNARSHQSKARRYQSTSKKHAQIAYRYLRGKVDALVVDMEQESLKLVEVIHGQRDRLGGMA